MKKFKAVIFSILSIFFIAGLGYTQIVKFKTDRVNVSDLPQRTFDVIRYETGTGSLVALALNEPGSGVSVGFDRKNRSKEGSGTTNELINEFFQKPLAFQFINKGDGRTLGFLLVPLYYRWLANYDKERKMVIIKILGRKNNFP